MERRRQLQFQIKTVLAITIVVAILMALRAWLMFALGTALVFAHIGMFFGPIAIVVASIVSGRQVDNRIDIRDNQLVKFLLKAWIACIAIVLTLWAGLVLLLSV